MFKTRASTSYSLGPKRRKVSEHATLIFHDSHDEETFKATSVFEFFTSLEILVYSWSVAGCFDVDWEQAKVKYFHLFPRPGLPVDHEGALHGPGTRLRRGLPAPLL